MWLSDFFSSVNSLLVNVLVNQAEVAETVVSVQTHTGVIPMSDVNVSTSSKL